MDSKEHRGPARASYSPPISGGLWSSLGFVRQYSTALLGVVVQAWNPSSHEAGVDRLSPMLRSTRASEKEN